MGRTIVVHNYFPRHNNDSAFEKWYKAGRRALRTKDAPVDRWAEQIAKAYRGQGEAAAKALRDKIIAENNVTTATYVVLTDKLRALLKPSAKDGPLSAWLHQHGLAFASPDKVRDNARSTGDDAPLAVRAIQEGDQWRVILPAKRRGEGKRIVLVAADEARTAAEAIAIAVGRKD